MAVVPSGRAEDLKPLTSLRFIAAAMIVLMHCSLYYTWPWLKTPLLAKVPLLHGVSFFFVLSGFILTHVYGPQNMPYRRFLWLRFARLWPVHAVCLIVIPFVVPAGSVTFDGPGMFSKWVTLAANVTLTHALAPYLSYVFSWNSVSWSISTAMFFYAVFPFLLGGLTRFWPHYLIGSVAVIGGFVGLAHWFHLAPLSQDVNAITIMSLDYANPLFRLFEFCLGMASYLAWRNRPAWLDKPAIATAAECAVLAILAVWFMGGFRTFRGAVAGDGTVDRWLEIAGSCWAFALTIVVMAKGNGVIGRILSLRLSVWLGEISFAVYMVHQILMKALSVAPGWHAEWIVLPAVVLAAAIAHHVVETPCRLALVRLPRWRAQRYR
jgi:peptidoglycan/LPS O-acetylase OafA/YrhL